MDYKKEFCEVCRKDVDIDIKFENMIGTIKGVSYEYTGKVAYCKVCGAEVYLHNIIDYNLKALYDAFRIKNNIISLEHILEIPKKYNIGKRPLSLLLGWGELTFSRYCDGDLPTKQYSDVLEKIYYNPRYYLDLLENNKNNLKSDTAYFKSKKAVQYLIDSKANSNSKIDLVIQYLLNRCEDITPLALQKALYYIQGFYYAFYKNFLFSEDCEAWLYGPVYRDVYFEYCDYKFDPIVENTTVNDELFSSSEILILENVVKHVCCYSGKVLEKFTHSEKPWLEARGDLLESEPSNNIISKNDIGEYFESIKQKYNMINPYDIKSYTQLMFQQI